MRSEALILDAVRTPDGRYGGVVASVRPDDLAAAPMRGLLVRQPAVDPAESEDFDLGW